MGQNKEQITPRQLSKSKHIVGEIPSAISMIKFLQGVEQQTEEEKAVIREAMVTIIAYRQVDFRSPKPRLDDSLNEVPGGE